MTSLLQSIDGVGKVQSLRRMDAESPFIAATLTTPDGPLIGVVDVRDPAMGALFADGVPMVAIKFQKLDIAYRVEVRRAVTADPAVLDCDLTPTQMRRWLVLLRPAELGDVVGPVVVDVVEPRTVALAKAFTHNLRVAFAAMCTLGTTVAS